MAPKKKAQKMALADFFADASSGSWADEMVNIPTAPSMKEPGALKKGDPGYLDSMPDRGTRPTTGFLGPPREELPLPTAPPYTAFVGNLVFEVDEEALRQYFSEQSPISVRLVKEPGTQRPKGFGYVEFGNVEDLKAALNKNGSQMMGRTIKLSVAEAPSRRDGFGGSVAESADQWRRTTPLPARDAAASMSDKRTSSYEHRDRDVGGGPDLDWGGARGSKFTPSAPHSPSGLRRDSSGPGRERDFGPSVADEAGQWRSARPMADPRPSREGSMSQRGGMRTGDSSPGLADTESTWTRGSKLRTPVAETPTGSIGSPVAEDRDWRSSRATSAQPSTDGGSPRQPPAPLERRKLNLAPRSVPATPASTTTTTSTTEPGSTDSRGIFGSAKPVDSAAREREAAEKMAARDEERKEERRKAAEEKVKQQKEDEEKGRALAEEKMKKFKEEREKATAAALAAQGLPATPATQPKERQPSQGAGQNNVERRNGPGAGAGNTGAWGKRPSGPGGPDGRRISSQDRPSGPNSNNRGPHSQQQRQSSGPRGGSGGGKQQPQISEDGFEGVPQKGRSTSSSSNKESVQRPVTILKKDSATRPGFSFAAAANSFGLLDEEGGDDADEEETKGKEEETKVNGNEEGSKEVEEVTNGVKEVTV